MASHETASASVNHFFVVGAQRSATTYLYNLLDAHPQIEMARPVRPEPKFFLRDDLADKTLADYHAAHFSAPHDDLRARGEKSTSYIESEKAARAIQAWLPDAKIIFLLREPVARAISNYHFSVENGLETLPIEDAFRTEETRRERYDRSAISASPYAYLKRGCYIDYIEMYERYFPRENLLIYLNEEFVGSQGQAQRLYAQLGVSADFVPPTLKQAANVSEKIQPVQLSPDLMRELHQYFADANAQLAAYLGRSLTIWQFPPP